MTNLHLCSDLHLCDRIDEQYAFEQIVDSAVAGASGLVIAGDNLDKQSNRSSPVAFFYGQLNRLQEAGVPVWLIEGQHDADTPPWFAGHPWAVSLHKQIVEVGPFTLYGLNFQPYGKLQEELAEIPTEVDTLIAHQRWSNWMGEITSPQGDFAQIPGHIQRLYTGDLHQWRLEMHPNADGVEMTCLSTGATTVRKIDEPWEHYSAVLTVGGNIRQKKLKGRVYVDLGVCNRDEDVDRLLGTFEAYLAAALQRGAAMDLPQAMLKPVFRVAYGQAVLDTVRRVDRLVNGRAFIRYKEIPPEAKMTPRPIQVTVGDDGRPVYTGGEAVTPLSLLDEELDRNEQPDAYALVSMLLEPGDQAVRFAEWKKQYMEG